MRSAVSRLWRQLLLSFVALPNVEASAVLSREVAISRFMDPRYLEVAFVNLHFEKDSEMRLIKPLSAVALVALFSFGMLHSSPNGTSAAETAVDANQTPQQTVRVYKTGDLPLFQKDGTWKPVVLMNLIESTVSPKTWEANMGPSTMALYPQNLSIVISTTDKNHSKIQSLLDGFRK